MLVLPSASLEERAPMPTDGMTVRKQYIYIHTSTVEKDTPTFVGIYRLT